MTWLLTIGGVALCGAACLSNDAKIYLWIPGLLLLLAAFRRATRNADNPRPGYITGKDQHHDH